MNAFAERLIGAAYGEVGYLEKGSDAELFDKTANAGRRNYTKYGAWYGINPGAWCAMFVSWCANEAGVSAAVIPRHASCSDGAARFKRMGRWHGREGYEPRPGDIVYFSNDGASPVHVGIVTRSENGRVYTVEGNTSGGTALEANGGCAAEKSYAKSYRRILGYASPAYPEEEEMSYEDFLKFMERYEAERAAAEPAQWSAKAREWAEKAGIIKGDGDKKRYRSPLTREEYVTMEFRQRGGEA